MKQGRASSHQMVDPRPPEPPRAHAVRVERVAQIGEKAAFPKKPLYEGRGYEAPLAKHSTHPGGSQGKY